MIHASSTASARARTARTVESHTVVQRICQTSGWAITPNDAWIDAHEIAPGRPGGASLKPASSATATGVTVSTATVISSAVGSHAPSATLCHPRKRTPVLANVAKSGALTLCAMRHDSVVGPLSSGVWGAISGPPISITAISGSPVSIIEKLARDDPLEDLGNLPLRSIVALELELVLARIVERPRRHVGARRRVAEGLDAPLRVVLAQREVDEDLRGVRLRRALDHREQRRLRAHAARLQAELGDRDGAQGGL